MVGNDRLADSVEFRMVDDRWIGDQQHRRMLEQEPQKGLRARRKVDRFIEIR